MCRKTTLAAVAAGLLLCPSLLIAGGPPWLSLPIDGVTPENLQAATDLLTAKLHKKSWSHPEQFAGIKLREQRGQWYLSFAMSEDVKLSDVEAALKGSNLSLPRKKLHLFGHAILEIEPGTTPQKELLTGLEAIDYLSVDQSEINEKLLQVTVDMPYPEEPGGPSRDSVGWQQFRWNDLASKESTKSESPATARMLPGYEAIRDALAQRHARLKDIRWSTDFACRPLGGVAASKADTLASAKRAEP